MATAPVKSQPLHNFSLPFLKWGGKSHTNTAIRCRRTVSPVSSEPESDQHDSDPTARLGSRSSRNRFGFFPCYLADRPQKQPERGESGAEADDVGQRMLQPAEEEEGGEEAEAAAEEAAQKPWNLRPRKAVQRSTMIEIITENTASAVLAIPAAQQQQSENAQPKSLRLRGIAAESHFAEKKEKRKFWIALSREEIEEDIFVMTGSRPARRPKKRPRNIQKQIDNVFPGLWLVGTTADSYRVTEAPAKR
ncbi:hypothetical protein I3843_11G070500 [Carya illinoinensis]|uniref:DUF1639 family protein n=1 Tax=Carya illinoinensis TaxID=32201 RepID=A0A8T1P522_CARIL|nr:uncharacterized protein LOC122282736 [Carya illinoinensis]KAG2679843.1 hypothetical protein I3760_11G070600 [Carya illinoinensis]KAG6636027.1 hypothetical protein CIPAW_11G082600 [Carya illinoinensis]KAG6687422.1 hypothetical protein I3842_11G070800 [Carya illinoinensis]KAG7955408.1 hypothetical protein I3843_11G070500 [Carya illinoinensis]